MESPAFLKGLNGGQSTMACGIGLHSKDFATLLMQFGVCLMTIGPYTVDMTGSSKTAGMRPYKIIVRAIHACISAYMDLRRYAYEFIYIYYNQIDTVRQCSDIWRQNFQTVLITCILYSGLNKILLNAASPCVQ